MKPKLPKKSQMEWHLCTCKHGPSTSARALAQHCTDMALMHLQTCTFNICGSPRTASHSLAQTCTGFLFGERASLIHPALVREVGSQRRNRKPRRNSSGTAGGGRFERFSSEPTRYRLRRGEAVWISVPLRGTALAAVWVAIQVALSSHTVSPPTRCTECACPYSTVL